MYTVYSSTKGQNSELFIFLSSQTSNLTQEVTQLKQPLIARIFPKGGHFVLCLELNYRAPSNNL